MKIERMLDEEFSSPLIHIPLQQDDDDFSVVINKIKEVRKGNAKGLIVYGSMAGCPYCEKFNGKWSEACSKCPKGVFAVKVMMENIPQHHKIFGDRPRSYPAVYSFVRGTNGELIKRDHSQERSRIEDIMKGISANGDNGVQSVVSYETPTELVDEDEEYKTVHLDYFVDKSSDESTKKTERKPQKKSIKKSGLKTRKSKGKKHSKTMKKRNTNKRKSIKKRK